MQFIKKLVGDRIYLSPRGTSDEEIEKFTDWMNDFQTTDFIGRSGQVVTFIGEKEWLENSTKNVQDRSFSIIELNHNKLIGTISLENFNWIDRSAVLGIFIGDRNPPAGSRYGGKDAAIRFQESAARAIAEAPVLRRRDRAPFRRDSAKDE